MTPSAGASAGDGRKAAGRHGSAQAQRTIRLVCPKCGRAVTVYEDEVGQAGRCPGCGAEITVRADAFTQAGADLEMTVADSEAGDELADAAPPAAVAPKRSSSDDTAELPVEGILSGGRMDYAIWQGVVSGNGDTAMVARLDALHKAEQAQQARRLPDGPLATALQMVLCEAAVAAAQTQSEADWRKDWTRRLVGIAARWPDETTVDGVVTVLGQADAIIRELKAAGVWPWQAEAATGA